MSSRAQGLLNIAAALEDVEPLLAYELAENVRALASGRRVTAVINPEVRKFEDHVESMVTVLKSLDQELTRALEELDTEDAKEFAKFFEDVVDAENEELRRMLKKTQMMAAAARVARTAGRTAGPLDFVKKLFKKDKKKEKPAEEEPAGMEPSYRMDEGTMDEFVEGKREWADPGHYIEQEMKENREFFDGVTQVLKDMEKARKEPSKNLIGRIKKTVERLIRQGGNLLKGIRKHLLEPAAKVEITEEGYEGKKPEKSKLPPEMLESTVEHYADMLKESLGDETKTLKYLKELFGKVGPMIEEERATLAARRLLPVFVRAAYASDRARKVLLPVIRRIRTASA